MAKIKWKKLKLKLAAVGLNIFENNLQEFFDDQELIELLQLKTDVLQQVVGNLQDKDPNDKAQILQTLKNFIKGPGSDYAEKKLLQLVSRINDDELRNVASTLVDPVDDALRILGDEDPKNLKQILNIAEDHFKQESTQITILVYALPKLLERIFKNQPAMVELITQMITAAIDSEQSGFTPAGLLRIAKIDEQDITPAKVA